MTALGSRRRLDNIAAVLRLAPMCLALGMLRHVVPLDRLVRWAWQRPAVPSQTSHELLVGRVLRACGLVGTPDRDCLQRSLLLYRELSRAGADPVLIVGFRRGRAGVEGHTWVVSEGRLVGESQEGAARFAAALTFGREGQLVAPETLRGAT